MITAISLVCIVLPQTRWFVSRFLFITEIAFFAEGPLVLLRYVLKLISIHLWGCSWEESESLIKS